MKMMNYRQPDENFLRSIDIHTLLPQQPPFVMVGRLTEFSEKITVSETVIEENNIFVENGLFSSSGLIENIAQTCAARIGYTNIYINKNDIIEIGYIGSVKNLEIIRLPETGSTITTKVIIINEIFGMTLADAVVLCGDEIIVKGEIKIALDSNGRTKDN